ncbi:phage major capsid protein [Bacillus mycoides]|uniref:phage major capsid protein n=1 Tax=Bacillus mycoides TaxID=1405 RepID=UPI000B4B971A|nr:phage major capsid protein [Bacillus mycoides]PGW18545.1 phage major capsid protein [Bacillus cereus]
MNEKIEQRSFSLSEVNQSSDGFFVRGLVNKTGAWSQTLYDKHNKPFIERVMPNVFARALQRAKDVKLLLEHDKNMLLARTKDETLKLTETSRGLEMEANLVPSKLSEHIHSSIKRGTLGDMSFGMIVLDEEWEQVNGVNQRSITDLALYECSIVSDGAYEDGSVEARSQDIRQDIEIPNLTERNYQTMKFESMTSKQLEERKQELLSEANEIEESKATEQRSFTPSEQLRQEAILNEIRTINEQIGLKNKTQRNGEIIMNHNQLTKEQETRAVEQFLRKQEGEELRDVTTGKAPGSLTIPTHLSNMIVEKLSESAPIFARTQNFTPVEGFLEILREKTIGTAGFVGEMQDVVANDFTMDKVRLDQKRVGTAIELSQHLVNDSGIDVVGYSIGLLSRRLGLTLDNSVLIGDKATQFEGILNDVTIGEQTGLSSTDVTIDELFDLYNSMHPEYIGGAVWVVNRKTYNKIAKLKDNNGQFYLVRDVATTSPTYKLFGQPILINDTMPDMETGQRAVLFANFSEGYVTMTKKGLNLQHITGDTKQALRGSQLIVLDGYMDGKILNQAAIKVLKMK